MTDIVAVKPTRGTVVHLHLPGYQPGAKPRPQADRAAMCGVGIWPVGRPPLTHDLVPLAKALRWTSLAPNDTDPRPTWTWCRPCIGHAVTHTGIPTFVLTITAIARGAPT